MYGSTTFFVLVQDQPTPDTRVWTVRGAQAGQFNLAAGMGTTGSLTRWFKDEFAHNLETFADIGADVRRVVAVGGGAQTRTWLQIVSDITGVTQILPQVTVGAAYGDAFLAGRAAGLLRPQDIENWVRLEGEITPQPHNRAVYDALYAQYLRLYLGTRDMVHRLKAITAGRFETQ